MTQTGSPKQPVVSLIGAITGAAASPASGSRFVLDFPPHLVFHPLMTTKEAQAIIGLVEAAVTQAVAVAQRDVLSEQMKAEYALDQAKDRLLALASDPI